MRNALRAAIVILAIAAPALPASAAREAQMIDQTGHAFTFTQLRATPLVVTFVSAHCKDVCPLIDAQIASAVDNARKAKLDIRFVTITLDPERDTAGDMKKLARTFSADPRYWLVAGGKLDDIHAIMRSFRVAADRGADGYADVHTTYIYLVDKHGTVRKTMLASNDLSTQVVAAVRQQWRTLAH